MNTMKNDPRLEQRLQTHYQNYYGLPPDPVIMWEQVASRLDCREKDMPWWKHLLRRAEPSYGLYPVKPAVAQKRKHAMRGVLVAAVILCLLVFTTSVSAVILPALDGLLKDLGIQQLQYTDFHQSKSIDGYTLTLGKAYADANLVIIGYTIEAPKGGQVLGKFDMGATTLTAGQNLTLPPLAGITAEPIGGINGNVLYYDASSIQGTPGELHLHLAIPYAIKTHGSLSFDFSVSFHPGRVANVRQAVTASGKTLILERVVVTPSETRFYVEGFTQQDHIATKLFLANLTVGGHVYSYSGGGSRNIDTRMINYDKALFSEQGVWTLAIQEFVFQKDTNTGQFYRVPVKGANWTFHVVVPES